MKTNLLLVLLGSCLTLNPALTLRLCAEKAAKTRDGKSKWETLFEGKSTAKFRGYKKAEFPDHGWVIESRTLHQLAKGGGGDIVTKDKFEDFELRFDWKVSTGANSGVLYRVTEGFDAPWQTGPEYQVVDDINHADGKNPMTSAASAYALMACNADKALKPVGEWNQARIKVKDNKVEHWLNKRKVVEYTLGSEEFGALIKKSKFKDMPKFALEPTGHICLQDHGDEVWFRNIRIHRYSKKHPSEKQ